MALVKGSCMSTASVANNPRTVRLPSIVDILKDVPDLKHPSCHMTDQHYPMYGGVSAAEFTSLPSPELSEPTSPLGLREMTPYPTEDELFLHTLVQDDSEDIDDIDAGRHNVSMLLSDEVPPAYAQGWYNPCSPDNQFAPWLEAQISGLSRDELVREFFRRDSDCETYGENMAVPRRPRIVDGVLVVAGPIGASKNKEHSKTEKERRRRHFSLQRSCHLRCCNMAARCGKEHAQREKKTKIQAAKGPGKDEQLCAAIYSQEFGARVVQSEHDGRKAAECVVVRLLRYIRRRHGSAAFRQAKARCCKL